jgi:hypothetical protein
MGLFCSLRIVAAEGGENVRLIASSKLTGGFHDSSSRSFCVA